MDGSYNETSRIDVDGFDVFVNSSFIYWLAKENGLDVGYYEGDPDTGNGHYAKRPFQVYVANS